VGFGRVEVSSKRAACLAALAAVALIAAGCDSEPRKNLPRPPIPASISVRVAPKQVDVSPLRVGFGPQTRHQVIVDERDGIVQGPKDQPLPVKLTIANTTQRPLRIELVGPERRVSGEVTPTGTQVLETRLPTGNYRVRVANSRLRADSLLVVGPDRSSPQNDLLLP
jgi:hypothetical protein